MTASTFDGRVAIVGGGTAGVATALALQRAGLPTVVVERAARPAWKAGEALPPAANPMLRRLGVWERFLADGHRPSYGNASAWGSPALVDHSFVFDPNGSGWHLDRRRFDRMLLDAARDQGTEIVEGTAGPPEGLERAAFVADATGRTAALARRRGSRRRHLDRLVGVVGVLATRDPAGPADARTVVEAAEEGWWYAAALPEGRLVVAFMTDGDLARWLAAHRMEGWSRLLGETHHVCARVVEQECRLLAPPRVVLANSSRDGIVAGSDWLAVGDAAIAHDPLSSVGITSALLLGLAAADAIQAHLRGDPAALAGYRALVDRQYGGYLRQLAYYYGQEQRWPDSPFWARRAGLGGDRADDAAQLQALMA